MKALKKALAASAVIVGMTGTASAQAQMQMPGGGSMPMSGHMDPAAMQKMMQDMMPSPSDSPSTKDFKESEMRMMKNMHISFTGDADVDFRTHMIAHHQGAIDMANVALKHAKDADTKKMAQQIIDDQEREIAEMKDWLKKRGK